MVDGPAEQPEPVGPLEPAGLPGPAGPPGLPEPDPGSCINSMLVRV